MFSVVVVVVSVSIISRESLQFWPFPPQLSDKQHTSQTVKSLLGFPQKSTPLWLTVHACMVWPRIQEGWRTEKKGDRAHHDPKPHRMKAETLRSSTPARIERKVNDKPCCDADIIESILVRRLDSVICSRRSVSPTSLQ